MSSDSPNQPVRILGIDPGLNITGYGVVAAVANQFEVIEAGIIRGGKGKPIETRLLALHDGISDIITTLSPDVVSLEELYSHYERPRTAILMGHARGVVCLTAAKNKIPVYHYAATQVKRMLTGNGRAPKSQIQNSVTRLLNLPQIPEPPDVADALAIALCHHFLSRASVTNP